MKGIGRKMLAVMTAGAMLLAAFPMRASATEADGSWQTAGQEVSEPGEDWQGTQEQDGEGTEQKPLESGQEGLEEDTFEVEEGQTGPWMPEPGQEPAGMSAQGLQEEPVREIDVSDMVYHAGGWGVPADMDGVEAYALSDTEQLKADIADALRKEEQSVDVNAYGLTEDDLEAIEALFARVLNENPEFFYVSPRLGYSVYESGKVAALHFVYAADSARERQELAEKVQEAVSCIRPGMSDTQKALVLHDYIAQHCAYAYKEFQAGTLDSCPHVYDAYGALVTGKAVCQGYAEAYGALLAYADIDSALCTSSAMSHAWNVITIDGEWYHVDVTWDDPVWNTEGKSSHVYFLLSDAEMANRKHKDWIDQVECVSQKYDSTDYWWYSVDSQIVVESGKYYYLADYTDSVTLKRGFQLLERTGDTVTVKYSHPAQWSPEPNSYYANSFAYLSKCGDKVYFNDDKNLYAMRLTDNAPKKVYAYEGGSGSIYGAMVLGNGTARLNIRKDAGSGNDDFITVDLGESESGMVSGKVISFGDAMEQVVLRLTDEGGYMVSETYAAEGSGEYRFEGIPAGAYSLKAEKADHVTREYPINISNTNKTVRQNVEIWLRGDVNGDGTINAKDKKVYFNYIAGSFVLSDYSFLVGDVNGDSTINAKDRKMVYNHIAGISLLWK